MFHTILALKHDSWYYDVWLCFFCIKLHSGFSKNQRPNCFAAIWSILHLALLAQASQLFQILATFCHLPVSQVSAVMFQTGWVALPDYKGVQSCPVKSE